MHTSHRRGIQLYGRVGAGWCSSVIRRFGKGSGEGREGYKASMGKAERGLVSEAALTS